MDKSNEEITLKDVLSEIKQCRIDTNAVNQNINRQLQPLIKDMITTRAQLNVHDLKHKICEKERVKKNVIVFGLKEQEHESSKDLQNKLIQIVTRHLRVDFIERDVDYITRIGKKKEPFSTPSHARPVLVRLVSMNKKLEILKNKNRLRRSSLPDVRIEEDFPPEVREKRKALLQEVEEHRRQGKIAYIKYDQIVVKEKTEEFNENKKRKLLLDDVFEVEGDADEAVEMAAGGALSGAGAKNCHKEKEKRAHQLTTNQNR